MKDYERVAVIHRVIAALWGISWIFSIYRIFSPGIGHSRWQWAAISVIYLVGLSGHIVLAAGASAAKSWARSWSLGAAAFYVLGFPLGTVAAVRLFVDSRNHWQALRERKSLADAWPTSTT